MGKVIYYLLAFIVGFAVACGWLFAFPATIGGFTVAILISLLGVLVVWITLEAGKE